MSYNRFIPLLFFSTVLFAQSPTAGGDVTFSGEVQSDGSTPLNTLYVELYDSRTHAVVERASVSGDGSFRLNRGSDEFGYTIRVVASPGEEPLLEESGPIGPGSSLVLRLPEQKTNRVAAGTVSLHELQHPIPKPAMRAVMEAQRYSEAHDTAKAIAKLEQAIRVAPTFRDAHANLGVQYARAGRMEDAVAQFRAALDIGPPNARLYSNLSLALLTMKRFRDGEASARKALALEPDNGTVQNLLRYAVAH